MMEESEAGPSTSASETPSKTNPPLPKCLKRYEPYFKFQAYDSDSNTFKLRCCIEPRCNNNKGKGISSTPISASNLLKHIKSSHRMQLDKITKTISEAEAASSSMQPTLKMFTSTKSAKTGSVVKQKQADQQTINAAADLLISELLPLSFVERPGFLKFMDEMCPQKKIPTRKTILTHIQVSALLYLEKKKRIIIIIIIKILKIPT